MGQCHSAHLLLPIHDLSEQQLLHGQPPHLPNSHRLRRRDCFLLRLLRGQRHRSTDDTATGVLGFCLLHQGLRPLPLLDSSTSRDRRTGREVFRLKHKIECARLVGNILLTIPLISLAIILHLLLVDLMHHFDDDTNEFSSRC